ncbi:MAG TPA: hypothetical protein PLE74_06960 [Candidatus Cloacimonadota bacterium]|nr:hypothetical protein [Candidatus Cloacimonadota bacterium]HPT72004.1 hypothetical protein [Candidatus Cloacimonadota bacterium]
MKVQLKNMVQGFTGSVDGLIYYTDKRTGKVYVRKSFQFKDHSGQPAFRNVQRQIYKLYPTKDYQYDLKDYCASYNALPENAAKPVFSWCHIYNKMMWNMQKLFPDKVDLKKITREQVYKECLPCISLKSAIEAGILPVVHGYERWDAKI